MTYTTFNPTALTLDEEEELYIDAYDYVDSSLDEEDDEYDNDEPLYGGYGQYAFDTYSTFDSNDYEYQQALAEGAFR